MDLREQTGYQMEPPFFLPLIVQSLLGPHSIFHIQEESVFLSWLDSRVTVYSGGLVLSGSPQDVSLASPHKAWSLLLSRVVLLKCSWAYVFGGQHRMQLFPSATKPLSCQLSWLPQMNITQAEAIRKLGIP